MTATVTHLHPTTLNPGRVIKASRLNYDNLGQRIRFWWPNTVGNPKIIDGTLQRIDMKATGLVLFVDDMRLPVSTTQDVNVR